MVKSVRSGLFVFRIVSSVMFNRNFARRAKKIFGHFLHLFQGSLTPALLYSRAKSPCGARDDFDAMKAHH